MPQTLSTSGLCWNTSNRCDKLKTLTIILTDGPYISEYAEMAYKIAAKALKMAQVNVFLYLDAVHIPKRGQKPSVLGDAGHLFRDLAQRGAIVRACVRCAAARGYAARDDGTSPDYEQGILITSLYDMAEMIKNSDQVISLSR
ncbi:MAG: DsrE/DsrF-like family protein [Methanosaeta sp. PtaU1.Bin028]|nr:MAG: DsrE/DsrF-like family protein [Methanosaeta sp. PtaU1.Bin028]